LRGIGTTEWSAAWRTEMTKAADGFIEAARGLAGKADALAEMIGLTIPGGPDAALGLRVLGQLLTHADAMRGIHYLAVDGDAIGRALSEIDALKERAQLLAKDLSAQYRSSVFEEDLRALLSEWIIASNANFLTRSGRQKVVRQKLQPFALSQPADDLGVELAGLIELRELHGAAQSLRPQLAAFGAAFMGLDTSTLAFRPWAKWADSARLLCTKLAHLLSLDAGVIQQHIVMLLTEYPHLFSPNGAARSAYVSFSTCFDTFNAAQDLLISVAGRNEPITSTVGDESWIERSISTAERWKANLHKSTGWCHWNGSASRARSADLAPLVDAIEQGMLDPQRIGAAFEAAYARWWTDRIMTTDPVLRTFSALRHEDTIARFRAADEKVSELTKRIVRARLKGDIPLPTAFGTDPEWGTLSRELTRRAKHQPLRQLFAKLPTVLTQLTPCVMMSPLSIAQYLPPDSKPFDVVIFDEASQIPVWDAVGAIARGKQVVIVGDPEQLPPTSISERDVDDIDDGTDVEDQESILDECLASNIPSRRLDWHYRSRSESLIAFSNAHYYNGRLVTFPSPITEDRAVRYVHVPNGVYERGTGRVNREEARAVVAEVVRRLKDPEFESLHGSLGVVTFNGEQQRLIENLLDHERRNRPELEAFFDPARWYEPVLVKNLEKVQGDERDTILFSVAVAPDQTGRAVSTISSLNKSGGHRRLNVAITRARKEMIVFATLRPEQIDLSRTGARGVREFKHFLEFAERGARAIAEAFAATGDGVESPFEEAVKSKLETRSWTVHTQIGVSSFRVDLGIVDPDAPGRYLAGVECDGATYHRSATARDRDRLRENILTQLGWRIRRVWSTDWWIDTESAIEKLHQQLVADLETSRAERAKAESDKAEREKVAQQAVFQPVPAGEFDGEDFEQTTASLDDIPPAPPRLEPAVTGRGHQSSQLPKQERAALYAEAALGTPVEGVRDTSSVRAYRIADLSDFAADPGKFYEHVYRSRLRPMIARVIAVEGPIYEDVLVQRIARAHGFGRAASRIREIVLRDVASHVARTLEGNRVVYWPEESDPSATAVFRNCTEGVRDHSDIPIAELASLADSFHRPDADTDETVRSMALYFNLARLREATRERFEEAVIVAKNAATKVIP
jgi:very-short-patch-repair endonuclease